MYELSPQERLARARSEKLKRENSSIYKSRSQMLEEARQYALKKKEEERLQNEEAERARQEEQGKDKNAFLRSLATIKDIGGNLDLGFLKGIEGIVDLGIGLVGAIGGMFSDDFKEGAKNVVAYDAVGNTVGKLHEKITESSYLNDNEVGKFIEELSQGVGQMLPSVGVAFLTGGGSAVAQAGGAAAKGAQLASMATFTAGAMGNATEEAFNEGADYYEGLLYGGVSGGLEGAIEMASGGIGGTGAGKVLGKQLGKNAAGRAAITFASEGAEEIASELLRPATKTIYKGKEALEEYGEEEYWSNMPRTFALGGATAMAMGGGQAALRNVRNKSRGGVKASAADANLNYIQESLDSELKRGKLTAEKKAQYEKEKGEMLNRTGEQLKKMTETQRVKYLQSIAQTPYRYAFAEDGTVKYNPSNSANYNAEAYTAALQGVEAELTYKPVKDGAVLGEDVKRAKTDIERVIGDGATVVITEMQDFVNDKGERIQQNGFYNPNDGIFYLNANKKYTAEQTADMLAIHEIAHSTEGTKHYDKLSDYTFVIANKELLEKKLGELQQLYELGKNSDGTFKPIDELSLREQFILKTEATAYFLENMIGTEEFINKLAKRDKSLVKKILESLKRLLTRKKKGVDAEMQKRIGKLVKLYEKALDNSIGGFKVSSLANNDDEEKSQTTENSVDTEGIKGYNETADQRASKNYARRDSANVTEKEYNHHYWAVANGVLNDKNIGALENIINNRENLGSLPRTKSGLYMVAVGENGVNNKIVFTDAGAESYSIERVIEFDLQNETVLDDERRKVYASERRGFQREVGELFRQHVASDFESGYQSDLQTVKRNNSNDGHRGRSSSQTKRIKSVHFNEDGSQEITYWDSDVDNRKSLSIDSEGKTLTREQQEFFSDSKVRDKDGKLMPVYHGTNNTGFTVFDKRKAKSGGTFGKGFYFTDSLSHSKTYGDGYKVYLNIKNPISGIDGEKNITKQQMRKFLEEIANNEDYGLDNYGQGATVESVLDSVYGKTDFEMLRDINLSCVGDMCAAIQLFNEVNKTDYDGIIVNTEIVAFDSNQIKLTTNKNPTANPDIRYSLKNIDGKDTVVIDTDQNIFEGVSKQDYGKIVKDYIKQRYKGILINDTAISSLSADEYTHSKYTQKLYNKSDDLYETKMKLSTELDNLITSGKFLRHEKAIHEHSYNINGYDRFAVKFMLGEKVFNGEMVVAKSKTQNVFYDVTKITPTDQFNGGKGVTTDDKFLSSDNSIRNKTEKVNSFDKDSEKNIRYSLSNTFSEQVDEVLNGADTVNTHLKVMETPSILQEAGLPKLPILMTAKHLKTITSESGKYKANYHNLSVDIIKQLPQLISEPVMIMDSLTKDDSIVVLTEAKDSANNPVIAAILIDGNGRLANVDIKSNILTSAYGKENFQSFLNRNAQANSVIYWNKKKTQSLIASPGLQLPNEFNNLVSNTIIRKAKGFVNSFDGKNKNNLDSDIRESRSSVNSADKNGEYHYTAGQVKKLLANFVNTKNYEKSEAEKIVNTILGEFMSFGEKYGKLKNSTKDEVANMLWKGLNTAKTDEAKLAVAKDVAEYILNNAIVENYINDDASAAAMYDIENLKPYLHRVNLSDPKLKEEIKYRYGNDNSIYLLWGASKKHSDNHIKPDGILVELESKNYREVDGATTGEIIINLHEQYLRAVNDFKEQTKRVQKELRESLKAEEQFELKAEIIGAIMDGFDNKGKPTEFAKVQNRIAKLKERIVDISNRNKLENKIIYNANRLKEDKLKQFANANQYKADVFSGSIDKLAKLNFRGNLNESGTRKIFFELSDWYDDKSNPFFQALGDEQNPLYSKDIKGALDIIAKGNGKFTLSELRMINNIVSYFAHFIENFNKVFRNGKYVDALPIAQHYVDTAKENIALKSSVPFATNYFRNFLDPLSVMKSADRYSNGYFTETFRAIEEAEVKVGVQRMELKAELDEFLKKNKKYNNRLAKTTIKYQGKEITVGSAVYLAMLFEREQAQAGLAASGITIEEKDKDKVIIPAFCPELFKGEVDEAKIREWAKAERVRLLELLTEEDLQYIKIAEKIFEQCKEIKRSTDLLMRGYSNVVEGKYVPIMRADIAYSLETVFDDFANDNYSFNISAVKGAKNRLKIVPMQSVLERHIIGISLYTNLSPVLNTATTLFYFATNGNKNSPVSVNSTLLDNKPYEFLKTLINDVKGKTPKGNKIVRALRTSYSIFQLAMNPKVWFTQLTSYIAGFNKLSFSSLTKAFGIKVENETLDKYCPLAKLRNYDNQAALAQGVVETVNKFGQKLMKPIGIMDRQVIKMLFKACMIEARDKKGFKLGSEENLAEAGKMLNEIILDTQQNSLSSERSAAMRSTSELMRSPTMFSADSMKNFSRLYDGISEIAVIQRKLKKANLTEEERASLESRLAEAKKTACKSGAVLVSQALFMELIALLFKFLYKKDDEETAQTITTDVIGNLLGGLPVVRDIYDFFFNSYDIDFFAVSMLNDVLKATTDFGGMVIDTANGKDVSKQDVMGSSKKMLYAVGQLFGIPIRNTYNMFSGLIKRFDESTYYKIDDLFYKNSYTSDLGKAVADGDERLASTIMGLILNEKNLGDKEVSDEVLSLYSKGLSALPKGITESIRYNGEEYAVSAKDKEQFKEVYSEANGSLKTLISSKIYSRATDEVKAKAIKFVYDLYYNFALEDFLGVDLENKNMLFSEAIDIEKLALIISTVATLKADEADGKIISGSKKRKIQSYIGSLQLTAAQKYMIMGYLGYKNINGETQVRAYINRLGLTKAEKTLLLRYSGYGEEEKAA